MKIKSFHSQTALILSLVWNHETVERFSKIIYTLTFWNTHYLHQLSIDYFRNNLKSIIIILLKPTLLVYIDTECNKAESNKLNTNPDIFFIAPWCSLVSFYLLENISVETISRELIIIIELIINIL